MNIKETKKNIIQAGRKAVNELIKVAEEKIITNTEDDINRIQEEENLLEGKTPEEAKKKVFKGFAEGRSK
jgi:hypothetical protein